MGGALFHFAPCLSISSTTHLHRNITHLAIINQDHGNLKKNSKMVFIFAHASIVLYYEFILGVGEGSSDSYIGRNICFCAFRRASVSSVHFLS